MSPIRSSYFLLSQATCYLVKLYIFTASSVPSWLMTYSSHLVKYWQMPLLLSSLTLTLISLTWISVTAAVFSLGWNSSRYVHIKVIFLDWFWFHCLNVTPVDRVIDLVNSGNFFWLLILQLLQHWLSDWITCQERLFSTFPYFSLRLWSLLHRKLKIFVGFSLCFLVSPS